MTLKPSTIPYPTKSEQKIIDCIRSSMIARGYPPSIREIAQEVGLSSISSVSHHLRAMENKGLIVRDHNRSRSIRIVQPSIANGPIMVNDSIPLEEYAVAARKQLILWGDDRMAHMVLELVGEIERLNSPAAPRGAQSAPAYATD